MAKKKMRQPTSSKELIEGYAGSDIFPGSGRYLIPGNKKGEMVYAKPMTQPDKDGTVHTKKGVGQAGGVRKQVQVKSKVKGGRGTPPPRVKPTASKGQIHSAANKEKIDKAAKAANKKPADYTKMPEEDMGPVMDSANRIAEMEAKAAKAMEKKKKVKKKSGGGKVYKRKKGGKVVSGNDGNSIVAACYD